MLRRILAKLASMYLGWRYRLLKAGFSINSHLTANERVRLFVLAKAPQVRVALEIGSYMGASAYFLAEGLSKKENSRLVCIDTWNNDAMSEGNQDTYLSFIKNTMGFASIIAPLRGFSTSVINEVSKQVDHIDLLFIDGDHSYAAVKADWDGYKGLLRPGSIVAFHDWGWAEGVKKVIESDVLPLVANGETLPNMWWV